MATVKEYTVTPLKFSLSLAEQVTRRRTEGESISAIAKSLKLSPGKAAMAELVGTVEVVKIDDPSKLARAVVKDRRGGKSWGWLSARYAVSESTARRAYEAATGEAFSTLDYRRAAKPAKPAAKAAKAKAAKPARKATPKAAAKDRALATAVPTGDA
jgi:hypothetical protein